MRSRQVGVSVTPSETRKASPGQPGKAYCRGCGKPDAETRWEPGVGEVYEPHSYHGGDGTARCMARLVIPPAREQR